MATAFARADYGLLGALGSASGSSPQFGPSPAGNGAGASKWDDGVLIDAVGLTGMNGSVVMRYRVDGEWGASASDVSRSSVQVFNQFRAVNALTTVQAIRTDEFHYDSTGNVVVGSTAFVGQNLAVNVPFRFGQGFHIEMELRARAGGDTPVTTFFGPASFTAAADFASTAQWLGFGEMRDANGNLVSDYTLTSTSGTNWSVAAIPEPSAIVLPVLTLIFLAFRLRSARPN